MKTIITTEELAAFCAARAARHMSPSTPNSCASGPITPSSAWCSWPCPETDDGDAVLVDPLAEGLSLEPLYDLFRDTSVVKVFHAARQDLEIFYVERGVIPEPLFDTQVAAMVCGFGEQVGYETLVRKIAKAPLDKSSRFTDWSRRPLIDAQKTYALADVTHLRVIYEYLAAQLERHRRAPLGGRGDRRC